MFILRFCTFIFCLSFAGILAEQHPTIKNTKREKAIDAAVGNFLGAITATLVAGFAHAYSKESYRFAQQLPWYWQNSDLYITGIQAGIVSYIAGGVAVIFAINGIFFAVEAYDAKPTQEPNADNSSNSTTTEQSHE